MKKFLIFIIMSILLIGCSNNVNKIDSGVEESNNEESKIEEAQNEYLTIEDPGVEQTTDYSENNDMDEASKVEYIPETSKLKMINVLKDGTFWALEEDEFKQEFLVLTNVNHELLQKIPFVSGGLSWEIGLDGGEMFVFGNLVSHNYKNYYIYNINTMEDITNYFIEDYDEIISVIRTETDIVFVCKKTVKSFEEDYPCIKLLDSNGNELFNISLDKENLLTNYNIEKVNTEVNENPEMHYAGNNVYSIWIDTENYKTDTLIVDLNRNKIFSGSFGEHTEFVSDGNYTVATGHPIFSDSILNHETGVIKDRFTTTDYDIAGQLAEGMVFANDEFDAAYLDIDGNVAIDLNQYARNVQKGYEFHNGVAPIELGEYVTFIDKQGEFLFEPVEISLMVSYEKEVGAVVARRRNEFGEDELLAIYKDGNVTELGIGKDAFLIDYQGEKHWLTFEIMRIY